jgi:membrane protease YdiL (CAAX protease family)
MIRQILRSIAVMETPAPPWALTTAVLYAIGAFAAVVIGTTTSTLLGPQSAFSVMLSWIIGMILIALYVTVTRNRTPQDGAALAIGPTSARLPLIILLSVGVGAAIDLIGLAVTGVPSVIPELSAFLAPDGAVGIPAWIAAALLLLVAQPIGEGLVFRGVAYPALRTYLGAWTGFVMVGVWHGIFHLVSYSAPGSGDFSTIWYTLGAPILAGLYLNAVRATTRSTRASMVAHAGLGLFALVRLLTLLG